MYWCSRESISQPHDLKVSPEISTYSKKFQYRVKLQIKKNENIHSNYHFPHLDQFCAEGCSRMTWRNGHCSTKYLNFADGSIPHTNCWSMVNADAAIAALEKKVIVSLECRISLLSWMGYVQGIQRSIDRESNISMPLLVFKFTAHWCRNV